MSPDQMSQVLMCLTYMFEFFGFSAVSTEAMILQARQYAIIQGEKNTKQIYAVFNSMEETTSILKELQTQFEVTGFPFEGKGLTKPRIEIATKQLLKLWQTSLYHQKQHPPKKHSKEFIFIESLFKEKGLLFRMLPLKDEYEAHVIFQNADDCKKAAEILTFHSISYADDVFDMYVSLVLQDVLIEGVTANETSVDTVHRHAAEHAGRLRFFLHRISGLKVFDPQHGKQPNQGEVFFSGSNGSRRLTFADQKHRDTFVVKLSSEGFHCCVPPNGEKQGLIVDLQKTTMPITAGQFPIPIKEILQMLDKKGLKPYVYTLVEPSKKNALDEKKQSFCYKKSEDAAQAAQLVRDEYPGITIVHKEGLKNFAIPERLLTKKSFSRTKKAPVPPVEVKVDTSTQEPAVQKETMTSLFNKTLAVMYEEVRAELEPQIRATCHAESLAMIRSENHIVPRCIKEVSLPVSYLGTQIVIEEGKVTIPWSLVEESIKDVK